MFEDQEVLFSDIESPYNYIDESSDSSRAQLTDIHLYKSWSISKYELQARHSKSF